MESYFDYDTSRFNFVDLVSSYFGCQLDEIHLTNDSQYDFFKSPGNDSDTYYHKKFYDKMRDGWPEFISCYENFVTDFAAPIVGAKESIIYQKWPTFRVHLPNNVAVGGWHRDYDYNHPEHEINFIVALTPMFESNTTIAEGTPGKMDFRQFTLDPGQAVMFNGNKCLHGNLPNKTGKTRVSFDFRVMLPENYDRNVAKSSLSKNKKFVIGDYYEIAKVK